MELTLAARGLSKAPNSHLAKMLAGVEGASKAQIEQKVKGALKSLAGKSDGKDIQALLERVELNPPNVK